MADEMSKHTRPNIVFVLCDNTGWGDFACYGGSTPTPRIDKFAAQGIRFTNYTVESQCTPTRSAILTGRQSGGAGPQIGYNFNIGGVSIYTNLRGYTEFDSYRRVQGHAIYFTVNLPLSALLGGHSQ
jgi:hypothetical protein